MTTATFIHFDPGAMVLLFGVLSVVPVVVAVSKYVRQVFR